VISLHVLDVLCYIEKYKTDLTQNLGIYSYNTRRNLDFHVQFCKIALLKKSVVNMGIKLYSKVPNRIKKLGEFFSFQKRIQIFSTGTFLSYDK
jgi:hypothetical protein